MGGSTRSRLLLPLQSHHYRSHTSRPLPPPHPSQPPTPHPLLPLPSPVTRDLFTSLHYLLSDCWATTRTVKAQASFGPPIMPPSPGAMVNILLLHSTSITPLTITWPQMWRGIERGLQVSPSGTRQRATHLIIQSTQPVPRQVPRKILPSVRALGAITTLLTPQLLVGIT